MKQFFVALTVLCLLSSCGIRNRIAGSAGRLVINDSALITAHVGISIFDPSSGKYLYNHQADKYFVPASNTKIPTCYAAMKYLGDSITGLRYYKNGNAKVILPGGDPTFLLPEFRSQPLLDFFNKEENDIILSMYPWKENALGSGWAWNDYQETYMAERSLMPLYGNVVHFSGTARNLIIFPRGAVDSLVTQRSGNGDYLRRVTREKEGNNFIATFGSASPSRVIKTIDTRNGAIIAKLLSDTLKRKVTVAYQEPESVPGMVNVLKTQPTDSILRPMMHRSDNFFAEQSLLMVSNEMFGQMDDSKVIDSILSVDFRDLPQRPRWADGSGLSRYNLFTPMSMVQILAKMKNEFGMERLKNIFPTGGEGTISNYYREDAGFIFGKTGTLSGVVAFSGYLYTKKGKLLIFSTLVNNHQASATDIRKAVEKFLVGIRGMY